jgi:hypothetical protein
VHGEFEIFQEGDPPPPFDRARKIPELLKPHDRFEIHCDSGFADEESRAAIDEVARLLGVEAKTEIKKAVEFVNILWLGLGIVVGGFLQQLGAIGAEKLKDALTRIASRRKDEWLLIPYFFIRHNGADILVEVILSSPSPDNLTRFLDSGLNDIMPALTPLLGYEGLAKVVFEQGSDRLVPLYGLRSDAVLLFGTPGKHSHGKAAPIHVGFSTRGSGTRIQAQQGPTNRKARRKASTSGKSKKRH